MIGEWSSDDLLPKINVHEPGSYKTLADRLVRLGVRSSQGGIGSKVNALD